MGAYSLIPIYLLVLSGAITIRSYKTSAASPKSNIRLFSTKKRASPPTLNDLLYSNEAIDYSDIDELIEEEKKKNSLRKKVEKEQMRLYNTTINPNAAEPMFSVSYDPLEDPNQQTMERDLEDMLMERGLRFLDKNLVGVYEKCYLVGLEDKSAIYEMNKDDFISAYRFTLEESLIELSELASAAGLTVVGSTYQRVAKPNLEYYIGQGKTKDIARAMVRQSCTCVIFDTELSPSQQKNLELAFNQERNKDGKSKNNIKVIDRTALILDIFAQHARTKEGQLQVQLALMTYRLPRLTNMWTHLERQSAGAKGKSSGGVGLRGPGEKQLESDKRELKSKISLLNGAIDNVRRHRSMHRNRRKRLGLPVVALVGYTNSGKSTLLNSLTNAGVFAADMLFATLDPTTRLVRMPGLRNPDILLTDTVGFIQKIPTNLMAAFRATLEEITEADVLLHVTDITNDAWRKQEASVLKELADMGLADKPIITVWNKIDMVSTTKEFLKFEARKRGQTVAMSSVTGEGAEDLVSALETALSSKMDSIACTVSYDYGTLLNSIHNLGVLDEVQYLDEGIYIRGKVPLFLREQLDSISYESVMARDKSGAGDINNKDFDWKQLAKGRHKAREALLSSDDDEYIERYLETTERISDNKNDNRINNDNDDDDDDDFEFITEDVDMIR